MLYVNNPFSTDLCDFFYLFLHFIYCVIYILAWWEKTNFLHRENLLLHLWLLLLNKWSLVTGYDEEFLTNTSRKDIKCHVVVNHLLLHIEFHAVMS